jgi:hypothetical protein
MSYYVRQSGFEGTWLKSSVDVMRHLCDLFGWNFADRFEHLLPQIESIQKGCALKHPDLSLSIERY